MITPERFELHSPYSHKIRIMVGARTLLIMGDLDLHLQSHDLDPSQGLFHALHVYLLRGTTSIFFSGNTSVLSFQAEYSSRQAKYGNGIRMSSESIIAKGFRHHQCSYCYDSDAGRLGQKSQKTSGIAWNAPCAPKTHISVLNVIS